MIILDADILPYEIGYVMEKDQIQDWPVVQKAVDNRLQQVRDGVAKRHPDTEMKLVLSDPAGVFRSRYATILPYKGNRTRPKPLHWDGIRAYLRDLGAISMPDLEGDDTAVILKGSTDAVLASRDKDFGQIVGARYSWAYGEHPERWYEETPKTAAVNLWTQMLVGDSTDNILGLFGVGAGSAHVKKLWTMGNHKDMALHVKEQYVSRFGALWLRFFGEHLLLLKLLEEPALNPEAWAARWLRNLFTEEEAEEFVGGAIG